MNITNAQFKALEEAVRLLPEGEELKTLDERSQEIILRADQVLLDLFRKKEHTNQRTARYIAEKRKTDKNYARSKVGKQA